MRARFLVASLGGHILLFGLVIRLRTPVSVAPSKQPIAITFTRTSTATRASSSNRATSSTRAIATRAMATRAIASTPAITTTSPASEEPGPRSAVNLFPGEAIASVIPSPTPNLGGTTRRPGGPSDRDEGTEVAARVDRWLSEASGADLARSARIAPVWRDVQRQIDGGFHPRIDQVTRDHFVESALKQLFIGAKPESGPTPRSYDGSHDVQSDQRGFAANRADQVAAAQRAYESPRGWKRVEIDADIDGEGRLLDLRVVLPSGRHELDQAALAAVRQAIERRPPHDGHVIARWAVEAAVASKLPAVSAITDETSGRTVGAGVGLSLSFDESTGKVGVDVPFKREVHTRVSLISLRRL